MTQARIDGDEVWVVIGRCQTSSSRKYHTRPDCVSQDCRRVGTKQLGGSYEMCEICAFHAGEREDHPYRGSQGFGGTKCPFCEEDAVGAVHIRQCNGGGDE
jgi:hypothetical protein